MSVRASGWASRPAREAPRDGSEFLVCDGGRWMVAFWNEGDDLDAPEKRKTFLTQGQSMFGYATDIPIEFTEWWPPPDLKNRRP